MKISEPRASILVVDDEKEVRRFIAQALSKERFSVFEASSKDELFAILNKQHIELITLDLNLGADNGLELARECRIIRNIPIIMITGRDTPSDRVLGLEYGADDYIIKPFHLREMIIRIERLLERYKSVEHSEKGKVQHLSFDRFVCDFAAKELRTKFGSRVPLTETEFNILELLITNPARVFSRDEIWFHLRGNAWSPLDRTLDGHIARLRNKIEKPEQDVPHLIKSVRGIGYIFVGDVGSENEVAN